MRVSTGDSGAWAVCDLMVARGKGTTSKSALETHTEGLKAQDSRLKIYELRVYDRQLTKKNTQKK